VHLRKDRIVARPEPERTPGPVFAVPGAAHDIQVWRAVHEEQLVVGRVAGAGLGDAVTVDDPVGVDEIPGEADTSESQRMLWPVVVLRGVVAIPDQLDPGLLRIGSSPVKGGNRMVDRPAASLTGRRRFRTT
jgi:hypothetical protein